MSEAAIEAMLRRDRAIVAAALVILTALAWAYVWWLAADMDMSGMDMSGFRPDRRGSDDACERALLTIITAHIAKTNAKSHPYAADITAQCPVSGVRTESRLFQIVRQTRSNSTVWCG